MRVFYSRGREPVSAVQWLGNNIEEIESFLGDVELFWPADVSISRRILIADPAFPFWLECCEWLTRDQGGDLDGWPDNNFRETFTLQTEGAAP